MNCRPRRLFQEIGQRIGVNWFKQPRSHMILVSVTNEDAADEIDRALQRELFAYKTETVFTRRQ